jgi:hypothetical protein
LLERACEIACGAVPHSETEKRLRIIREKILPAVFAHPDKALVDMALQRVARFLKLSDPKLLHPKSELVVEKPVVEVRQKSAPEAPRILSRAGAAVAPRPAGAVVARTHVAQLPAVAPPPNGPRWMALTGEMKFVVHLVFSQREDLPTRLRHLFEGTEGLRDQELVWRDLCGETLSDLLSSDSKELVRDILHFQHSFGGESLLGRWQALKEAQGEESSTALLWLVAFAQGQREALEALQAHTLLRALQEEGGSRPLNKRASHLPVDFFKGAAVSSLRLSVKGAELSARKGTLKSGLEYLLQSLEKEYVLKSWRRQARLLAAGEWEEGLSREEVQNEVERLEGLLEFVTQREAHLKKSEGSLEMV